MDFSDYEREMSDHLGEVENAEWSELAGRLGNLRNELIRKGFSSDQAFDFVKLYVSYALAGGVFK